jgi:hypothetical protein
MNDMQIYEILRPRNAVDASLALAVVASERWPWVGWLNSTALSHFDLLEHNK